MTLEFAERKLSTKNRRKDNTSADAELLAGGPCAASPAFFTSRLALTMAHNFLMGPKEAQAR